MAEKLPVFVVDDDASVLKSLKALIRAHGHPTFTYASAEEFLADYDEDMKGCLLLDVRMPGMNGLTLQSRLESKKSSLPVVIITGHGDVPRAVQAMKAGAIDFIEKPFSDEVLLESISRAHAIIERGGPALGDAEDAVERLNQLTPREREVLDQLVLGHPNKTIAHELRISPRTVEIHRARIKEKLGARSLSDLIRTIMAARAPSSSLMTSPNH